MVSRCPLICSSYRASSLSSGPWDCTALEPDLPVGAVVDHQRNADRSQCAVSACKSCKSKYAACSSVMAADASEVELRASSRSEDANKRHHGSSLKVLRPTWAALAGAFMQPSRVAALRRGTLHG